MTPLNRAALARVPLTEADVERLYASYHGANPSIGLGRVIRALCESHERLRAELKGAEAMMADYERALADYRG